MIRYDRYSCYVPRLIIVLCLVMVLFTADALAGQNPSVRVCNELGEVTVRCHRCSSGERLGDIVVTAGYNAARDSCVKDLRDARRQCSQTYGVDINDIQIRYDYWLGTNQWKCTYPQDCK